MKQKQDTTDKSITKTSFCCEEEYLCNFFSNFKTVKPRFASANTKNQHKERQGHKYRTKLQKNG